jgi:hypothetical protein
LQLDSTSITLHKARDKTHRHPSRACKSLPGAIVILFLTAWCFSTSVFTATTTLPKTTSQHQHHTSTSHIMYHPTMLFIAFLFVLQYASAVTLNDFTPRLTDLTGACQTIYTSNIDNCVGQDFETGECSSSCVSTLLSLGSAVRDSCQGQHVDGSNIIAAFIKDQGAQNLCRNAASVMQANTLQQTSASYSIGSSTMTVSDLTPSNTGIAVDTSSLSTSFVTALSTATIQPLPASSSSDDAVFTGVTSTITGTSLAFATNTPSSVLMATQTALSSTQAAKHTNAEPSGGTPFDTSAAHRGSASYPILLCGVLAFLFSH